MLSYKPEKHFIFHYDRNYYSEMDNFKSNPIGRQPVSGLGWWFLAESIGFQTISQQSFLQKSLNP